MPLSLFIAKRVIGGQKLAHFQFDKAQFLVKNHLYDDKDLV